MPPIVSSFKSLYSGITLKIVERYRAELIEAAGHGEFDLVITTLPVDTSIFTYETLFVEENVVTSKYPLPSEKGTRFSVISASALNGLSFAMLNEEHLMQRELNELIRKHRLILNKEVECSSLEALVEMVKAGVGVAFIPASQKTHLFTITQSRKPYQSEGLWLCTEKNNISQKPFSISRNSCISSLGKEWRHCLK